MTVANAAALQDELLGFWFGVESDVTATAKRQAALWWGKDARTDTIIAERFTELRERAILGELDGWEQTSRGRLALILLIDQVSRNIFRDRPEAFSYDYAAQELCLGGIDMGADQELRPIERVFFYLPMEHSESRVDQTRSVMLFSALVEQAPLAQRDTFEAYVGFARQHQAIVERFGRFPHRNAVLKRESSAEELKFLSEPGSSF